jgi:hypothetical protein
VIPQQSPFETQDGTSTVSPQPTRVTSQKVLYITNARKSPTKCTAPVLRLGFSAELKQPPSCDNSSCSNIDDKKAEIERSLPNIEVLPIKYERE